MKVLVSGVCGFVGSTLAEALLDDDSATEIIGFDNLSRAGSHLNLDRLRKRGVTVRYADVRSQSDLDNFPAVDWIIDAAANPSVLAGVDGTTSSRQLVEHNLYGTVNLLELAKRRRAGFVLLSTSRVYSVKALSEIPVAAKGETFRPAPGEALPTGVSAEGIAETFSVQPPLSLYGASKLASESLALEYGEAFNFPVWINRCGVLAGAGQFGHVEQGIFSYWINAYRRRRPLRYIGFDGAGRQCRDCFHPRDLVPLLKKQFAADSSSNPRVVNLGGGARNAMSLAELSRWCAARFGEHEVTADSKPRLFDVPWLVMDSRLARETWDWQPAIGLEEILQEIANHAEAHPDWLEISAAR
ncbi:MAG TPA: NAD-dependent epimerase/dehydratase family protein [Chthoniobacterales bacterium]|jgi:CDP-paratose 2-epimerase|nr:NAD-dependent epimerase/dehydratase family protein [Chthoniobacterales bacterium]